MNKEPLRKLALSVTRGALLAGKSDHAFREFLYNFSTVAERVQDVRRYLGERIGISGPQYNLMMAIAELQGREGVSVGRVAEYLHVAAPFVTTETGKLARMGYLRKANDAADRRVWRLSVGPKGWAALRSLFPGLQQLNDAFFAGISQSEFAVLRECLGKLVENSEPVLARIGSLKNVRNKLVVANGPRMGEAR
jgi:MarR family transcriptional regulator, organic hydroperoxide resistance regulator